MSQQHRCTWNTNVPWLGNVHIDFVVVAPYLFTWTMGILNSRKFGHLPSLEKSATARFNIPVIHNILWQCNIWPSTEVSIACWHVGQSRVGTTYQITLSELEPANYRIRIIAEGEPGDRRVYRRTFTIPENPLDCSPYLTDDGISSSGDTVTFTFTSTGLYSSFMCQLDRDQPFPCKPTNQSREYTDMFLGGGVHSHNFS